MRRRAVGSPRIEMSAASAAVLTAGAARATRAASASSSWSARPASPRPHYRAPPTSRSGSWPSLRRLDLLHHSRLRAAADRAGRGRQVAAALVQFAGPLFFNVTTFAGMIERLDAHQADLLVLVAGRLGSVCFLVSSVLAEIAVWGRWSPRGVRQPSTWSVIPGSRRWPPTRSPTPTSCSTPRSRLQRPWSARSASSGLPACL